MQNSEQHTLTSALTGTATRKSDWQDWRWQLQQSQRGLEGLLQLLQEQGCSAKIEQLKPVVARYRFQATPYYLSLINWHDPADPIRLQCLPDPRELDNRDEFSTDPFSEIQTANAAGVVHRYPDRVLLPATTACAVYCRHCTRKNTLETSLASAPSQFGLALEYIRQHPEIREVLISGGDPLLLEETLLDSLLRQLHAIEHIEVVRIGTRVPVVLPMRINARLAQTLRRHGPLWINTQFNHPRELTNEAVKACGILTDAGIPVSNQSVLLKGVNADFETMYELCAKLQRNRIRPYYVFLCDPIAGISHLRTTIETGRQLEERLWRSLGGLALPRFVADLPNQPGKIPLANL
jgi:lysine 2,3-aminomutase